MSILPMLAGRLVVGLLLVLLAAGTVLAAAAARPSPIAPAPAEETSSPLSEPTATTAPTVAPATEAPTPVDPTTSPPTAAPTPVPTAAPTPVPARMPEPADEDADEDADGPPSPANLARVVAKLDARGITTTTGELAALAAKVGLGGAVRVLVFADASGRTPARILATFESGKGWGVIARELGLHPGIGWIMGNGRGPDRAAKAEAKAERARERAERRAAQGD